VGASKREKVGAIKYAPKVPDVHKVHCSLLAFLLLTCQVNLPVEETPQFHNHPTHASESVQAHSQLPKYMGHLLPLQSGCLMSLARLTCLIDVCKRLTFTFFLNACRF